jgi:hypothetical protein
MSQKQEDKKTTAREALTCVAISYFSNKGSSANLQEFNDIITKYYYENDDSKIFNLKNKLSSDFKIDRVKELYKDDKKALAKSGSQNSYTIKQFKLDFPEGKEYSTEDGGPTNLDAEIKSAYATAEILKTTPILGNLSQYVIYDQSSKFMKTVKDDALNNTLKALDLPSSIGADILSSIDIILVRSSKENIILSDFENHISGKDVDNMTILNNLAFGDKGKNTFRTLTNKYFFDKDMVGISLKKVPSNRKANVKIVGTVAGARGELKIFLDPYTEFLARVEQVKSRAELYKLVDELVEVTRIMPTDPRAVFVVEFKLNYKNVDISSDVVKIGLEIGRSGFNASTPGQIGFVGGASYAVTLPILQRYPRYNQMVREVVSIREKAFNFAVDSKKVPKNIQSEYRKALSTVKKNVLVLYDASDNNIVKDFCKQYDDAIRNPKNSFQEYRIGVSKLCKNKSLNSPHGKLKDLDTESFQTNGTKVGSYVSLHNDYVHSQGLWIYTRQGEDLKKYFKKQISLTLYGIMAKKGSKVFYSKQKGVFTEEAFVKEFKAKNNKTKLAKVVAAPYLLIS